MMEENSVGGISLDLEIESHVSEQLGTVQSQAQRPAEKIGETISQAIAMPMQRVSETVNEAVGSAAENISDRIRDNLTTAFNESAENAENACRHVESNFRNTADDIESAIQRAVERMNQQQLQAMEVPEPRTVQHH